jgi:hypothetical protein
VKLKATQRWMKELQRNLELLVNSIRGQIENKTNEINNIRTELADTFEPLIGLLKISIDYMQSNYDGMTELFAARGFSLMVCNR